MIYFAIAERASDKDTGKSGTAICCGIEPVRKRRKTSARSWAVKQCIQAILPLCVVVKTNGSGCKATLGGDLNITGNDDIALYKGRFFKRNEAV